MLVQGYGISVRIPLKADGNPFTRFLTYRAWLLSNNNVFLIVFLVRFFSSRTVLCTHGPLSCCLWLHNSVRHLPFYLRPCFDSGIVTSPLHRCVQFNSHSFPSFIEYRLQHSRSYRRFLFVIWCNNINPTNKWGSLQLVTFTELKGLKVDPISSIFFKNMTHVTIHRVASSNVNKYCFCSGRCSYCGDIVLPVA
jgi:hypothetical protein